MEEKEIGTVINDWLLFREHHPQACVEQFALRKYMEFHRKEGREPEEKEAEFLERAAAWREGGRAFEEFVGDAEISEPLEPWQGAEMLDNVISELDMDTGEQYRYLLNVKLLSCYRFLRFLDEAPGEKLKWILDREYETEWERAGETVAKSELQDMFAETVSLMRYAGAGYDDETRRILAEIGVGRPAEFTGPARGQVDSDIRFLTGFLVSEMVLSDRETEFTEEEQKVLSEQIIPVCVSSAAMVREGGDAGHVMEKAQAYLGRILTKKNGKLFFLLAAAFAAARAVTVLLELAVVCGAAAVGLHSLWGHCKERQDIDIREKEDFLRFFFPEKETLREENERQETEDAWNPADEEWKDETEFEDA